MKFSARDFFSYFFPQILFDTASAHNAHIRVLEERGKMKLLVNGSRQSGEYIRMLWEKTLFHFSIFQLPNIKTILVLGVGGGTVIRLLHHIFPDAAIDGVDIDEVIIKIGKTYFGLDVIPNLTFHVADAKQFVADERRKKKLFDLVIVDIYVGTHIPAFIASDEFLQNLKIISKRGVLINYLLEDEYLKKSEDLAKKLDGLFSQVRRYDVANNRFLFMVK